MPQYTNPGSAAVGAINDFLLQREAQKDRELARKHQSELEKRQIEREERQAKMQQEQFEYQKSLHEEAKKDKGYQRTEKRLDDMVPGDYPDPELITDAKTYGLSHRLKTTQTPTAIPEGFEGPMAATEATTIRPTMAQQEEQRKRETVQRTLEGIEDPDARRAAEFYEARGQALPADLAKGVFKLGGSTSEMQPIVRINPRTGKLETIGEAPKGSHYVSEPAPPASSGDADVSGMSAAAIQMAAKVYAKSGALPALGQGKQAAALKAKILETAASYDAASDTFAPTNSMPDVATNKASYAADQKALAAVQTTAAAAQAFSQTAEANAKVLSEVVKDIPDTGVSWLNRPWRAIAAGTGSTKMTDFLTLRQSLQNEYSRLLTSPGMTGVVTNRAREEMSTILSDSATIPQIQAALKMLATEAKNRTMSYQKEINDIKKRMASGSQINSGSTEAPATPASAPTSTLPPGVVVKRKY